MLYIYTLCSIVFAQSHVFTFSLLYIRYTLMFLSPCPSVRFYIIRHPCLQTYSIINMYRRCIVHPSTLAVPLLLPLHPRYLPLPSPRYVFSTHFAFPVASPVCLRTRRGHFYPAPSPSLRINPPAALFVHLEANVRSHGIIRDLVNINKCISSLSIPTSPSLSLSLSLSLAAIHYSSLSGTETCVHSCVRSYAHVTHANG